MFLSLNGQTFSLLFCRLLKKQFFHRALKVMKKKPEKDAKKEKEKEKAKGDSSKEEEKKGKKEKEKKKECEVAETKKEKSVRDPALSPSDHTCMNKIGLFFDNRIHFRQGYLCCRLMSGLCVCFMAGQSCLEAADLIGLLT